MALEEASSLTISRFIQGSLPSSSLVGGLTLKTTYRQAPAELPSLSGPVHQDHSTVAKPYSKWCHLGSSVVCITSTLTQTSLKSQRVGAYPITVCFIRNTILLSICTLITVYLGFKQRSVQIKLL